MMLSIVPFRIGVAHAERIDSSTELIDIGDKEFLSGNYAVAYEKYHMSSIQNDKVGNYRLSMLVYFGYGTAKDVDKAQVLLVKSAKQGYVPAQIVAGFLNKYKLDELGQSFVSIYYNWVKVSIEEGNINGMFYFALINDQKAKLYKVSGPAMSPTLNDQEVVLVNLIAYDALRKPQKGDIIVFKYPQNHNATFIKRVIATEGDDVEIKEGSVYVNDTIQEEDYVFKKSRESYSSHNIPQDTVFVLGDNRKNSEDSRFPSVGCVPLELIQGKVVLITSPEMKYLTR
jgi:signal peptidase I